MYSAKKVRFPIQIRHAAQAVAPLSPTKKPRVCGIFSTERARVSLLACGLRFREPSGSRITLLKMRKTPVSRPLPRSNLAPISNEKYLAKSEISFKRRGRDLNSRGFLRPATLAVWCLQPLGHLSKIFSRQSLDQKIVPRVCRGFFLKPVRCSLARIRPTRPPLQNKKMTIELKTEGAGLEPASPLRGPSFQDWCLTIRRNPPNSLLIFSQLWLPINLKYLLIS